MKPPRFFSVAERGAPFWGPSSFSPLAASAPVSPVLAISLMHSRMMDSASTFSSEARASNVDSNVEDFNLMNAWKARYAPASHNSPRETRARSHSPASLAQTHRTQRMTILPEHLVDPCAAEDMMSRSPTRLHSPHSSRNSPATMARCQSAALSVGPWAKSTRRVPRRLLHGRFDDTRGGYAGDDSGEAW